MAYSFLVKLYGANGLSVQLSSILSETLHQELDAIYADSRTEKPAGTAGPLRDDYIQSQVKGTAFTYVRSGGDYRFDSEEQQILSRGRVLEGGQEIDLKENDPTLEMLALHLYEQVDEGVKVATTQKLMRASQGKRDGKGKVTVISWLTKRVYFLLLGSRVLAHCFQSILERKLQVLLPLIFKKLNDDQKLSRVLAVVDQRYLDPDKHEEHLLERCNELFSDLYGKDMQV